MKNRMYFGDHNSDEMLAVITTMPNIPIAEEDGEWVQIAGADGERFISNGGLKPVTIAVPMWIRPEADVNAVTAWLSGAGILRFERWNWFWHAQVIGETPLVPCVWNAGWTTNVTFRAKPHRYIWPETQPITIREASTIRGRGTAQAKPIISVRGTGNVTLMVGRQTVLIDGLNGELTLDCEAKMAYSGTESMNDRVSIVDGQWPLLDPSVTSINWTGSVTEVYVTPRWRCR